jgi:transposase
MEQRVKFIMDALDGTYNMTELCDYYNISRKTGYKWLDRYGRGGIDALRNRSRAPLSHPRQMSHQVKEAILSIKKRFSSLVARRSM